MICLYIEIKHPILLYQVFVVISCDKELNHWSPQKLVILFNNTFFNLIWNRWVYLQFLGLFFINWFKDFGICIFDDLIYGKRLNRINTILQFLVLVDLRWVLFPKLFYHIVLNIFFLTKWIHYVKSVIFVIILM